MKVRAIRDFLIDLYLQAVVEQLVGLVPR